MQIEVIEVIKIVAVAVAIVIVVIGFVRILIAPYRGIVMLLVEVLLLDYLFDFLGRLVLKLLDWYFKDLE